MENTSGIEPVEGVPKFPKTQEFDHTYFVDTLAYLDDKIDHDDSDYDLIHTQEFVECLWDILEFEKNREKIRVLPLHPQSVLHYIGLVASGGTDIFDLTTYGDVLQFHKKLFSGKSQLN